ncbi:tyrosine-protein phosphatase [uncultured Robinsoniella sp.]|uniref:tyrosine-protein phosphatase n=1 Tax=uncultured Robinsoniella sp. TaxID=904190 RepID=UPI00374FBE4B
MTDIHVHILPGLDDGPETVEESIEMICMAYENGTDRIFAASHGNYYPYTPNEYWEAFEHLQRRLMGYQIPVELYPGMELYYDEHLCEKLERREVVTMNRGSYILLEFDFEESPQQVLQAVSQMQEKGYRVILAHPERYYFMQDNPEFIYDLIQRDCAMQINKGSIFGEFGTGAGRLAYAMLRSNLVQMVASDAHGYEGRTISMERISRFLRKEFSKEYAELLLKENPDRVIHNEEILTFVPHHLALV